MSLTTDQIEAAWKLQQQQVSPRYSLMDASQQAAFNTNLDNIWNESSRFILARYSGNINFGITPSSSDAGVIGSEFIPTLSINVGLDAGGLPIMQIIKTIYQLFTTQVSSGGAINAYNFYAGDNEDSQGNTSPNTSGLIISWEYDGDPTKYSSKRKFIRTLGDMTTWDESQPDQFAPNKYFLIGNTWVSKLDPTQTFVWTDGKPTPVNGTPLDQGLNSGMYDPNHPENINSGWALQSHSGNQWVWEFNYPDHTYVIKITQQSNSTFKHTFNGVMLTPTQWFTSYVGSTGADIVLGPGPVETFVPGQIFPPSIFPLEPE
jgi:hypothetical protein